MNGIYIISHIHQIPFQIQPDFACGKSHLCRAARSKCSHKVRASMKRSYLGKGTVSKKCSIKRSTLKCCQIIVDIFFCLPVVMFVIYNTSSFVQQQRILRALQRPGEFSAKRRLNPLFSPTRIHGRASRKKMWSHEVPMQSGNSWCFQMRECPCRNPNRVKPLFFPGTFGVSNNQTCLEFAWISTFISVSEIPTVWKQLNFWNL